MAVATVTGTAGAEGEGSVENYSVAFDAAGPPVDEEGVDRLMDALSVLEVEGAIVSAGGDVNGFGIRFSIETDTPEAAVVAGADIFRQAVEKASLPIFGIERVEAITEAAQNAELLRDSESYVGVAEIAEILGVSKQRVYELREKPEFPKPIAQLASGPVWAGSMLKRFISEWPRRRTGRPRKEPIEPKVEELMVELRDVVVKNAGKKSRRKVS